MGNTAGSTKIIYHTKDHIPIEYIYYDLKGSNRFPTVPENETESTHPPHSVSAMFEHTLNEIEAKHEYMGLIK